MKTVIEKWLEDSEQRQRLVAQEGLILEATEEVWAALERSGKSKADLARLLGTSKANVTQLLKGSRNLTLRTLADIASALGYTARIKFVEFAKDTNGWEEYQPIVKRYSTGFGGTLDIVANEEWSNPAPLRVAA
jgi:transcriptional regulator with XRE-family HTH domain